jgi:hypothetical protein
MPHFQPCTPIYAKFSALYANLCHISSTVCQSLCHNFSPLCNVFPNPVCRNFNSWTHCILNTLHPHYNASLIALATYWACLQVATLWPDLPSVIWTPSGWQQAPSSQWPVQVCKSVCECECVTYKFVQVLSIFTNPVQMCLYFGFYHFNKGQSIQRRSQLKWASFIVLPHWFVVTSPFAILHSEWMWI